MLKKISYIIIISLTVLGILTLAGCRTPVRSEWKPVMQPNTKWESEDGVIEFYVDNNYQTFGTIHVDDEPIEIYILFGAERNTAMYIYPESAYDSENHVLYDSLKYGYWHCDFKSEKEFVATVRDFPFFEKGYKFIIHRVDE